MDGALSSHWHLPESEVMPLKRRVAISLALISRVVIVPERADGWKSTAISEKMP